MILFVKKKSQLNSQKNLKNVYLIAEESFFYRKVSKV